ncbi:MAG: hypothetical protein GYA46_02565, partial [candidate division Zixibacteria bacterium]|nr:hypothetical protein [candidate division Zixibacteria bacterium]
MHKLAVIFALATIGILSPVAVSMASDQVVVPEAVMAALNQASPDSIVEVLLSFDGDLDAAFFKADPRHAALGRTDRYRRVMNQLTANRSEME